MMGNQTVSRLFEVLQFSSGTPFARTGIDVRQSLLSEHDGSMRGMLHVLNGDSNFVDSSEVKASKKSISDNCIRNT